MQYALDNLYNLAARLKPKAEPVLDRRAAELLDGLTRRAGIEHTAIAVVRRFLVAAGYHETAAAFDRCLEIDDESIKRRAEQSRRGETVTFFGAGRDA